MEANSSQAQARGDDVNDDVRSFPGVDGPHCRVDCKVRGQVLIPGWQGVPEWLQPMWDALFSDLRGRTHSCLILKEDVSRVEAMEN